MVLIPVKYVVFSRRVTAPAAQRYGLALGGRGSACLHLAAHRPDVFREGNTWEQKKPEASLLLAHCVGGAGVTLAHFH